MKVEIYLKKRIILFVLVTISLCLLLVITNIFLRENQIVQNSFIIKYGFSKSSLNILNYPLSQDDGRIKAPSNTISIKNKTSKRQRFQLVLNYEDADILDKFYFSLDNGEAEKMREILYEGEIAGGEMRELDLKVWLGLDLIEEQDQNHSYQFTVLVKEKWELNFSHFFAIFKRIFGIDFVGK